ncbi:MAG TPA: ABC transporter permease, partial [Nannocystis sp.]
MSQLLSFAAFELRHHLRRPITYVFMAAMFFLAFLFATTDAVSIGGVGGKLVVNSPWVVNMAVMILTLIGMIMTSAISGTAVLRDFEIKAHELLFTTRLRKSSFVFGRFLGAYAVTVLVFSCSALGLAAAMWWPWMDPERIGPGGLVNYLWPITVYILPNALLACALFFAVGIVSRSFTAVYVQGVVLFSGYSVALTLLSDLDNEAIAGLL